MLSENANRIFEMKYAKPLSNGGRESWDQAVARVSEYVARGEKTEANYLAILKIFYQVIYERSFMPAGRIFANAGTNIKNLMNCFVLPIEDSRQSIYETLGNAAEVFAAGGGIGYNFSHLRESGSMVSGTKGKASGPLSFMSLFDRTGEVISQASRRGAQMGILNIDHPDIVEFINYKNDLNTRNLRLYDEYLRNLKTVGLDHDGKGYFSTMVKTLADDQLTHFNISAGITDEFMKAVVDGDGWNFTSVTTGEEIPYWGRAEDLLGLIARNAWENGDPGLFFLDRANKDNMVIETHGPLESTNPCGEVPLLPYEGCCLGSLNLANFADGKYFDWIYLRDVIRAAVRFLDNVQELNETAVPEINQATKSTRRLGLGVMGLADALIEMEMPYDSPEAIEFCEKLSYYIGKESWIASIDLAKERGYFASFNDKKTNWNLFDKFRLEHRPPRNVAVTSIAPTGTIALVADVNGGIEPYFALSYLRNITQGIGNTAKETMQQEVPLLREKREIWDDGKVKHIFRTAHDIHWKDHIAMQAIWQKYTDNAVSKTINMPYNASVDDIMEAYRLAWEMGLKGITVYRDRSKLFQILNR